LVKGFLPDECGDTIIRAIRHEARSSGLGDGSMVTVTVTGYLFWQRLLKENEQPIPHSLSPSFPAQALQGHWQLSVPENVKIQSSVAW
jgi:hypothetical protein